MFVRKQRVTCKIKLNKKLSTRVPQDFYWLLIIMRDYKIIKAHKRSPNAMIYGDISFLTNVIP